jgi:hypothetical protein
MDYLISLYTQYSAFTQSNPFLGAAVAASLIGVTMYLIRDLPLKILKWVYSRFIVTFELPCDDVWSNREMFETLTQWLHCRSHSFFSRTISISRHNKEDELGGTSTTTINESYSDANYNYLPIAGSGTHVLIHQRKLIWYNINVEENSNSGVIKKTLKIRCFGFTSSFLLNTLLSIFEHRKPVGFRVSSYTRLNGWINNRCFPRPITSVALNRETKDEILQSMDRFFASRERYIDMGVTWKLSLMLAGEPGTGKTSLAKALASHYGKRLCTINLSSASDSSLEAAVDTMPNDSILLLEDIDCSCTAFSSREHKQDEEAKFLSLSGVLNILDGIKTPDGLIVIMTTNYPERLDPAILRKGRTDHYFFIQPLWAEAINSHIHSLFGVYPQFRDWKPIKGCDLQALIFDSSHVAHGVQSNEQAVAYLERALQNHSSQQEP